LHPSLTKYRILLGFLAVTVAIIWISTTGTTRWGLISLACSLAGLIIGLGVSFPQMQFFGESFCQAKTREKQVSLTFDDGPDPVNTPALLSLLAERQARATFFLIGCKVADQPQLARKIVAEGHSVENHTYRHSPFTNLFLDDRLNQDLIAAQTEIEQVTGHLPIFFRPPVGLTNPRVFRVTRKLKLQVAGYTARGLDRRPDAPEKIAGRLLAKLRPGAIFLLHDGGVPKERLLAVVTLLLDHLQVEGYRCVPLDELKALYDAKN